MEILITDGDELIARIPLAVEVPGSEPVKLEVVNHLPQSIRVAYQGGRMVLLSRVVEEGQILAAGGSTEVVIG